MACEFKLNMTLQIQRERKVTGSCTKTNMDVYK